MDEKDREIQKTREYNYVLWAIIVIFGLMIVDLFAQHTCTDKLFVEKVSFASTLSSIILSVIAIIMTVVSNDSISSLLHKVRDLHENIKDVPSDIKMTSKDLNNSVSQLNSLESKLRELPSSIKTNIDELKILLDNVIEKIDGIDKRTEGFDELIKKGSENVVADSNNLLLQDKFLEPFINRISEASALSIYICISAFKVSVPFNLDDITAAMKIRIHLSYITGVINIFRALGLVELKQDYNSSLITITNINKQIIPLIENKLSKGIALNLKKRADDYVESLKQ